MIAVLALLVSATLILFNETRSSSSNLKLADEILRNIQERTSIRDQFFLYREEHMLSRWNEAKLESDQLLRQAKLQFQGKGHLQIIDSLIGNFDEAAVIFNRIAVNSKKMKSAASEREILEELNKRLSIQLLLKDTTIRNSLLTLKDLTTHGVEQSYRNMIIVVFLIAGVMAFFTLLFSASLMRLIRMRLIPLHDVTTSIGSGNLECRINVSGSDEFTDLAHSVNVMMEKLAIEIETRIKTEEELQQAKTAEQERRRSEEAVHSLIEWTPVATIVHRDGRIIYTNSTAIKMFGAESQLDLHEKPFLDLMHKEFHQASLARKALAEQGIAAPMMECKFVRLDGTVIDAEIQSTVFEYIGGKAHISCIIDISERKKAEEERHTLEQQFQQTQKLESLGVLSGGIAHDFNNILAIIVGYCSLIKLNYGTAEKNIPIIEEAAERGAALCRQMLAYAGKARLSKTKINMVEKVEEIVCMLKVTLPQNTVIKPNLPAAVPLIEGDASQIGQVVMNLIINSSEAIGNEQGVVDVSLAGIKITAAKKIDDYNGKPIPPGEYICLEVSDNGCGMDDATRWRIFEPFFTTKFTGRGLGMSAVLGIIKSHAGALQLFSQPGKGTTFKVYLPIPISETARVENQIESAPVAPWRGSGTILLAEDEEPIRGVAREFLEMFGFTVLEAANGREALELFRKSAAEITLVITDMGMPVMDGYELFFELKKLNPELQIIVSSGYGDTEVAARIGSDDIAGFISKPYNPDQLLEILKRVIR